MIAVAIPCFLVRYSKTLIYGRVWGNKSLLSFLFEELSSYMLKA